jgi:hypothetical protein
MKLWFSILLLSSTLLVPGQIKLNSSLETGYEDRIINVYESGFPTPATAYFKNSIFSTFDISAAYKGLNLYSDVKTNYYSFTLVQYNPVQVQYRIGASYSLNRVEFKYEHLCSHSIEAQNFYEGYDRISVKVKLISR